MVWQRCAVRQYQVGCRVPALPQNLQSACANGCQPSGTDVLAHMHRPPQYPRQPAFQMGSPLGGGGGHGTQKRLHNNNLQNAVSLKKLVTLVP